MRGAAAVFLLLSGCGLLDAGGDRVCGDFCAIVECVGIGTCSPAEVASFCKPSCIDARDAQSDRDQRILQACFDCIADVLDDSCTSSGVQSIEDICAAPCNGQSAGDALDRFYDELEDTLDQRHVACIHGFETAPP